MSISVRSSRKGASAAASRWRRALAGTAFVLALSRCAVGPDFVPPEAPHVTHFTGTTDPTATIAAEGVAQHFEPGAKIAADWWRLFNAPKLGPIITEAIANNATLQAAEASLRESQYNLRAGYGVFYPSVGAGFSATRQKYSTLKVGETTPSPIFSLFTLSATVSYALDVFGGERRMVEGLSAAVDVQAETARATYLTLTGNIVNALIAKAAYGAELEATRQTVDMMDEQVKLTADKANAGTAPYLSVLTIESQRDTFAATIPPLEQKLTQADDLLATLVGRTPAEYQPTDIAFSELTLPRDLPVSLPSDLVRQRPDILVAEATLHQASAAIGVATAALLPSFSLDAGYGANNTSLTELFARNTSFWNFGANITTPVFEGGTLWFRRKAAIEGFQQSLGNYRQTVLGAFAQVADTLRALEHDARTLHEQDQALAAAEQALHLVQANYAAGLADYVQVLIADTQYQQAKIAQLEALALRYQDTVALFVALGGSWSNADSASGGHDS
jgi:NodT family efflux transporter outer membrane factor (OMF) lipoprotein